MAGAVLSKGNLTKLREHLSKINVESCRIKGEKDIEKITLIYPDGPYNGKKICLMNLTCETNGKIKVTKSIYCKQSYCKKESIESCYKFRLKVEEQTMSIGEYSNKQGEQKIEAK